MKHNVVISRTKFPEAGFTEVWCSCGRGKVWTGRDASSQQAAKAWKREHEKGNG